MITVTPRTICITGGIGAGKSVVSTMLRLKGFTVYDCDSRARSLMLTDAIRNALTEILGDDIYDSKGTLRRKEMAERIFSSPVTRLAVNAVVHEAVRQDLAEACDSCHGRLFFVETAIPATSHIADLCHSVWLVDAPEKTRLLRACQRDDTDETAVRKRMESQSGEFSSLPEANISVIVNDGETPLLPQIDSLLESEETKPI